MPINIFFIEFSHSDVHELRKTNTGPASSAVSKTFEHVDHVAYIFPIEVVPGGGESMLDVERFRGLPRFEPQQAGWGKE